MIPLYRDPWFTFRFNEARRIDVFFVEGIEPGQRVAVHALDMTTRMPGPLLVLATVGEAGKVALAEPLVVQAGEGFLVLLRDE
jgi:hypothetical protein